MSEVPIINFLHELNLYFLSSHFPSFILSTKIRDNKINKHLAIVLQFPEELNLPLKLWDY
jgi:hypothetical protein